jgi:hypothetical protein
VSIATPQTRRSLYLFNGLGILAPAFLTWCAYLFLQKFVTFGGSDRSVETVTATTLVGYSFTTVFFLIALPRNGHLEKLDASNLTSWYVLRLGMPAVVGTVQLVFAFLSVQKQCLTWARPASTWLFFVQSTILSGLNCNGCSVKEELAHCARFGVSVARSRAS